MASVQKRKLIEVALPLEAINKESVREKSIRHGHPSILHLWWARRPLVAARAVLFAQLVDDPSSHPDRFPTEEDQRVERERLHELMRRFASWSNVRDERLLAAVRDEIMKSTGGHPPVVLDPFAGGGTIPLEAKRLGLEAHASDLNPVAVLINKALIEIPPKFQDLPPVFPGLADSHIHSWKRAEGLAADVRSYGAWMRDEARRRIGNLYPSIEGKPVIAWIWARTVICPNPACGIRMPLVRSWRLSKKKGKETYLLPMVVEHDTHPSGKRIAYEIGHGSTGPALDGTMSGRNGAICLACGAVVDKDYIKAEGAAGRMAASLLAIVAGGDRQRVYFPPNAEHEAAAEVAPPADVPDQELGYDPRNLWTPQYGLTKFSDLFTNRQLVALTTLSSLVAEARERVLVDALAAGMLEGDRLAADGLGASAYADAVATYLALAVSRTADLGNSIVTWSSSRDQARNLFARQAIPMAWDFVEVSPFAGAAGDVSVATETMSRAIAWLPAGPAGKAVQADAAQRSFAGVLLSTDPPYYDNVVYSDLSDFFYVWLRRCLRRIHPGLMDTMLVPKAQELVANPYRRGGKEGAKRFFEEGFRSVFAAVRRDATDDFPVTVYYAFKQSESEFGEDVSTGWETLLEGMISSGWEVTSTWPLRSERDARMIAIGTNALASSIVLSLRPRPANAPTTDRRGFIAALQDELPSALRRLQQGKIAPVDLPQAAIGPGMAVYSRYSSIIEDNGSRMSVRSALARINEILDQVLNEQEGDFDGPTRFAIAWYRQFGYKAGSFGDADNIARARNTAVDALARDGILTSRAGVVSLIRPQDLNPGYDIVADKHVGVWEALHHLLRVLEFDGIGAAGELLAKAVSRPTNPVDADLVYELAFLLHRAAEKNGWTKDAIMFNALGTSWAEIVDASRGIHSEQLSLDYGSDE